VFGEVGYALPVGRVALEPFAAWSAWRHAFGSARPTSTFAFAAGGAFQITCVPIARDDAVLGNLPWRF
jgi:uncharacterized protein with beta-barrel porin domain